jgi:hypothetical protein
MKGKKLNILINFWLHLGIIYRNLANFFQILTIFFLKGLHNNSANFRKKKKATKVNNNNNVLFGKFLM